MSGIHFVTTHAEAKEMVKSAEHIYVGNCFCREGKEGNVCARTRHDV